MSTQTRKKAQSAVEYVVTYGWMLIAVIAMLLVLYYLGIFNPGNWLSSSNEVVGTNTFSFLDYTIKGSNGAVTLYMKSESPYQLNVTGIAVNGANLTNLNPSTPITFNSGQSRNITANSTLRAGRGDSIYNMKIEIYFTVSGGGAHTDSGVMRGKYS